MTKPKIETVTFDETMPEIRFDQGDALAAFGDWGCNCGPGALAAATGLDLDQVQEHIGDFKTKKYMSPTMMAAAIGRAGWMKEDRRGDATTLVPECFSAHGLVRVQWCGSWTKNGSNPRWAYGYTHWVACFVINYAVWIFDINSGLTGYANWVNEIVPLLLPEKGNGKWYPSHIWPLSTLGQGAFGTAQGEQMRDWSRRKQKENRYGK